MWTGYQPVRNSHFEQKGRFVVPTIPTSLTRANPATRRASRPRARCRPTVTVEAIRGLRGLRACTADQAGLVRSTAEYDRSVLPRYHQDDRGWNNRHRGVHYFAAPGKYAQIRAWDGRQHWLAFTVPTAVAMNRQALTAAGVSRDTFTLWARVESNYAQDQRTGRRCIVRPDTVAAVAGLDKRTVQRCRALAETLGLRVVVFRGRMLNVTECFQARKRGSTQRGLSTEAALTVPLVVGTATPTSGNLPLPQNSRESGLTYRDASVAQTEPAAPAQRRPKGSRPRRDRRAIRLAQAMRQQVTWLRTEQLSALIPALHRFATTDPGWTATDVIAAIDTENNRRGWTSITTSHVKTRPAAILAWYLRQLDPQADHPRLDAFAAGTATEQRTPWCGHCDQATRQIQLEAHTDNAHPVTARCLRCHPLSPEQPW